jgi:hypothetical protein
LKDYHKDIALHFGIAITVVGLGVGIFGSKKIDPDKAVASDIALVFAASELKKR